MDINSIRTKLQSMLLEKRFNHSLMVCETAKELARMYGADEKKAEIAGLLHDCAKNFSKDEMFSLCEKYAIKLDEVTKKQVGLIHAFLGAEVAKDLFGIDDDEIYDAIFYHTVGKPDMSLLTKIIYIADAIEPLRNYDGVEHLRELAHSDLDKALVYQIDITIKSVLKKGSLLHLNTVDTRNYYLSR
ncbi:bis(5'-nucleosyl)-tetraphosphatase (symmetrical) YqeK [Qingrenia yutianensis]|uniref:bis(5'-nucleosyl)-tetraphosphatase (symmetrical) n=1 Tax=Qingrenia yutianensis TaxID=2763676 RepID=A0A926IRC9_9FIRM|nr:bis(5'-nucleosyl)-tetraphosphatase (symmetrical) YqeK [Qingrenia yutianensis]MBC8595289.1 bis(5'-nucleosyl)-tetraphosphatase (symmetrical) YqeK [Qingrenia yutianensis]